MVCSVYQIRNKVNGKLYIGSSVDTESRWRHHVKILTRNKHHSEKLQHAWNKYGEESFAFEIITICSEETVRQREQYFLDVTRSFRFGYNMHPETTPFTFMPDSIRAKQSKSAKRIGKNSELRRKRAENARCQHKEGRLGQATWKPGTLESITAKKVGRKRAPPKAESIEKMRKTKVEVEWNKPGRRERQAEIARELQNRPGFKQELLIKTQAYWTPERRLIQAERARASMLLKSCPPEVKRDNGLF